MKPGFGYPPMTFDGGRSDPQNVCRFFNREAAEVAQLNHTRLLRIKRRQCFERIVQRDQFRASFNRSIDVFVEREFLKILATLLSVVLARMIDQQTTHYLRSHSEEVSSVLPVYARLIDESYIGLMDQCSRLKRVVGTFTPQVVCRKLAQFIVDDG